MSPLPPSAVTMIVKTAQPAGRFRRPGIRHSHTEILDRLRRELLIVWETFYPFWILSEDNRDAMCGTRPVWQWTNSWTTMLSVSYQGHNDSLWFSLAESDSPLGQDALAHNSPHTAQNSVIRPQSPTCGPEVACKSLVSKSALVVGNNLVSFWGLINFSQSFWREKSSPKAPTWDLLFHWSSYEPMQDTKLLFTSDHFSKERENCVSCQ